MKLFNDWFKVKRELNELQAKERKLREKLVKALGSGTHEVDDFKVTVTTPIRYTIDQDELELIQDDLSAQEVNCIIWKPSLSVAQFKKLADNPLLSRALISKEGAPQITLKLK